MGPPLRVLIVEDNQDDAELIQLTLSRAGFPVVCKVVQTPAAMRAAVESQIWDVITSDHSMPQFSAPAALALAKELCPGVPFFIVSDEIDLNLVVSLMRGGVKDYIKKRDLKLLIPTIERELREAELRRERQKVEEALAEANRKTREVEAALRESEDKFRYLFDNSVVGKSITRPSGEVEVNKAFCDTIGYTQDEFRAKKWQEVTHPDDIELTQKGVDQLLSGARNSIRFNKRFFHKNGSVVWVDLISSLRRDKEGKPLYLMTTLLDITERVQAEEEIRQLNAELEQRVADRTNQLNAANLELEAFSYSVSHDLRAPLRSLNGFSSILLENYSGRLDEQGKHYLARIQENTQRMETLINDLLKLARVTRSDFNRQRVDLSALAHAIAADLKTQYPGRGVKFEIAADLVVHGDGHLLKIALENLLGNAYKFTGQRVQAIIQVGAFEQNEEQVYFVRDNGAGFNMDYANKLFGAFQRLHSEKEFPGTGIGLATVQRIINRHGGRIWVESEVDQGATFYFTIAS
jgi:PAS domain S-box-containing protein